MSDVTGPSREKGVQDTAADDDTRTTALPQRRKRSDAEIIGLDLVEQQPPAQVYKQISLPNYAGPTFRRYMAIVDARINYPLVLEPKRSVSDPSPPPDRYDPQDRHDTTVAAPRRRWLSSAATNLEILYGPAELQMEPGTSTPASSFDVGTRAVATIISKKRRRTLWSRTKTFVRRMLCCGA